MSGWFKCFGFGLRFGLFRSESGWTEFSKESREYFSNEGRKKLPISNLMSALVFFFFYTTKMKFILEFFFNSYIEIWKHLFSLQIEFMYFWSGLALSRNFNLVPSTIWPMEDFIVYSGVVWCKSIFCLLSKFFRLFFYYKTFSTFQSHRYLNKITRVLVREKNPQSIN